MLWARLHFLIESISCCAFQDYSHVPCVFDCAYGVMSAVLSAPAFGECLDQAVEVGQVETECLQGMMWMETNVLMVDVDLITVLGYVLVWER